MATFGDIRSAAQAITYLTKYGVTDHRIFGLERGCGVDAVSKSFRRVSQSRPECTVTLLTATTLTWRNRSQLHMHAAM